MKQGVRSSVCQESPQGGVAPGDELCVKFYARCSVQVMNYKWNHHVSWP